MDIVFVYGSKITRFLQGILYWRNWKNIPSHVQLRYNDIYDISAEFSGVKLMNHKETLSKYKCEIYEFPYKTKKNLEKFKNITNEILKRKYKYDFYLYIRWFLNISVVFIPFILLFSLKSIFILLGLILLTILIINPLLIKKSKLTYACSEITAIIYKEFDVDFGYDGFYDKSSPYELRQMVKFAKWKQLL